MKKQLQNLNNAVGSALARGVKKHQIEAAVLGVTGLMLSQIAGAVGEGLDFTALTTAVDVTTVVAAISAIAALKMAPGFAKWAYNKVIGWFR